jgi:hypothetical protein
MTSTTHGNTAASDTVTPALSPGIIPALSDGQEIVIRTDERDRVSATVQNEEVIAGGGRIVEPGAIEKVGLVGEGRVLEPLPTKETDIRSDMVPREWPDAPDTFTTLAPVALRRMIATRSKGSVDLESAARTAAAVTIDSWYFESIEAEMVDILTEWLRDYHPGEIIDPSQVPDRWEALDPLSTEEEVSEITSQEGE